MMQIITMEMKDVKQFALQFDVVDAYLVPYEHESRTKEDGTPAIWYKVVLEIKVSREPGCKGQTVVISTSRKTHRGFADVRNALSFVDEELEGLIDQITVLRKVDNEYNAALSA